MFANVVTLYRESQHPAIDGGVFCYSDKVSDSLRQAIDSCRDLSVHFGRFEDGPEFDGQGNVEFGWRCSSNEYGRFYQNVSDVVGRSQSVHRGVRPFGFYLMDEDYLASEPNEPPELSRLYEICDLIQLLAQISIVGDASGDNSQPKTLVFVLPAGGATPPRTIRFTTRIDDEALSGVSLDIAVLQALADDANDTTLHIQEHRSLFRLAVADVVGEASGEATAFGHLIRSWPKVLEKYRFDADCYISNFSFERFRSAVATAQAEFSAKLTGVMGDSASRFLALPLPFVALVGIVNTEGLGQAYLLFLGAMVVVLLYSGMVHNQLLELARIDSSFDLVFKRLEKQAESAPETVSITVADAREGFDVQRSFLKRTLYILRVLAWLPVCGGLAILAFKFHPGFKAWFLESAARVAS